MADNSDAATIERKSRKSYSLEKKLQCTATANRLDNTDGAAKTWGTDTRKLTLGRTLKLKDFDTGLAEWVYERRALKQKVTYKRIMQEAALRLKNIPSGTNLLRKAPADYAEKIIKFVVYTDQLRMKEKFKHVYGADET